MTSCASELLERGAVLMKERDLEQITGSLFRFDVGDQIGGCCALGAIALAAGITPHYVDDISYDEKLVEICPALGEETLTEYGSGQVMSAIWKLNDLEYLTIDEIIHWLKERGL